MQRVAWHVDLVIDLGGRFSGAGGPETLAVCAAGERSQPPAMNTMSPDDFSAPITRRLASTKNAEHPALDGQPDAHTDEGPLPSGRASRARMALVPIKFRGPAARRAAARWAPAELPTPPRQGAELKIPWPEYRFRTLLRFSRQWVYD